MDFDRSFSLDFDGPELLGHLALTVEGRLGRRLDQDSTAYTTVFLSLSVLTVVLNALVIITIWKDPFKNLKGIPNYLLLNLAVSDLFVGIPAELLIALLQWYPYKGVAKAAEMSVNFGFYASGLTLLVLAVERLIAISYPLKRAAYLTYTNLTLRVLCIWLFAGLSAILPELETDSIFRKRVIIFDSFGILILTLIVACYARIFFLVRKCSHRDLTTEVGCEERQCLTENAGEREKIKRRERSLIRYVVILVGLLIVCWAPYSALRNIALFCGKSCVIPDALTSIARWLCFLHPLANPIAYSLCTRKFRRALWKIICKCNSALL